MKMIAAHKLEPIRALILDVDGVLTDGKITYTANGMEIKSFHVRDGSGLKYWHRVGHLTAVLSGRESAATRLRAKELGVKVVEAGAKDKLPALRRIVEELGIDLKECAYLGDDLPDIPPMRAVGLPLAIADAAADVREIAVGVTESKGGAGAAREVVEIILRAQGRWESILERYLGPLT